MDEYLIEDAAYKRLVEDHKRWGSIYVAYDFDSTVSPFHNLDASHEMVKQLIRDLKAVGATVVCWTANPDHTFVEEYLKKENIPCDGINTDGIYLGYSSKKPFFSALLDDRAGLKSMYEDLVKFLNHIKNEKDESI